jgi:hypothetical protein
MIVERVLHHFPLDPLSRQVRLALGEKRLPFHEVIERYWERPESLTSLNPSGLPPVLFNCVRAAVDVVNDTGFNGEPHELERYRARVITRVLTQAQDFDPNDVDYLVDKLGDALTLAA